MSGVRAAHDIHFMDADLFFFADALEHALRPRSLHANVNSGILGFERLAQPFRDWKLHRRVERERTLLAGGLDQGRTQRGRSGAAAASGWAKTPPAANTVDALSMSRLES